MSVPAYEHFESEDGKFRYVLTRDLGGTGKPLVFCMLNPSTADATQDDPTIRRCIGFARRENASMLVVVNLYAYRATQPAQLANDGWQVGEMNDRVLKWAAGDNQEIVCAWGAHGQRARVAAVCTILRSEGARLRCFGHTQHGAPRHPLYIRGDAPLVPYHGGLN
jgi:hypothetical protein